MNRRIPVSTPRLLHIRRVLLIITLFMIVATQAPIHVHGHTAPYLKVNRVAPTVLNPGDWNAIRAQLPASSIGPDAYLKASNTDAGDMFGRVAADGDTLVVGAPYEASAARGVNGDERDNTAPGSGAVYVFVRSGSTWTQQAYLKASNADSDDSFGSAVAISGTTIVVGAPSEDGGTSGVNGDENSNTLFNSGAAYVFVRSGTEWSQQAYLKASNPDAPDMFGTSVGIDGDTIVVGSLMESSAAKGVNGNQADNSAERSGAAYVFVRTDDIWVQQAYLKAFNTDILDGFGGSVAIDDDTIVIGAWAEASATRDINGDRTDNSAVGAGAAYVFVRTDGSWTQQAYLKASNADEKDYFGGTIAIAGDTIVVTAEGEASASPGVNGDQDDNSREHAGAAYVFVRTGDTWTQQAYLKSPHPDTFDHFGSNAAVLGDHIVIGAPGEATSGEGVYGANDAAGAAYVFARVGGEWSQAAYLTATNQENGDSFGTGMALMDGAIIISTLSESSNATGVNGNQADNSAPYSGAVYTFTILSDTPLSDLKHKLYLPLMHQ
ncbi:MAG TPA: FG-GAP repeat protein [Herpetosiphonaceae bacterium]|nr:FG-GAP repeat protein [Herpetosiphonaceae bacterium]